MMQKGLFGTRTPTPQEQARLQKERELRKRQALFSQLRTEYDQHWATLDRLAQLAHDLLTLSQTALTPTDLPYPAEYPHLLTLIQSIPTRITEVQSTLALPEDLHATKADCKTLISRTHRVSEAIGTIQHLFWTVKSTLKHRTVIADGRLCVVPNTAEAAQIIIRYIESDCR